jgi:hypothetical protein
MSESKEVVNWEEKLAEEAQQVAKMERPPLSTISLRSGMMAYQDNPIPGNKLRCIIVASAFENAHYSETFDPNNFRPPDCFALSLDGVDMAPHEKSHNPYSDMCVTCPNFKWGSDPKGGRGKACKAKRRLALIPENALQEGILKAEIALLTVPVTSVKNWGNYVNRLSATTKRPAWAMVTEISTKPHAKNQFEVFFEEVAYVDAEHFNDLQKVRELGNNAVLTPYEYIEEPEEEKKPAKTGKRKY